MSCARAAANALRIRSGNCFSSSKVALGRPKPRIRVLPSPFMPTRLASSPALSGELQKSRYLGSSDVAGALLFAGGAGGDLAFTSPRKAQTKRQRRRIFDFME